MIDHTHDHTATSWVASAQGHADFPIQNLPLGIFSPHGQDPRPGVAIGEQILDLRALGEAGLISPDLASQLRGDDLKGFLALGKSARVSLRHRLFALLLSGADGHAGTAEALHLAADCMLHVPARPHGYTDFYAGIVHATNVGSILRPDNPLLPNYKYVPIGYHGRTSSIRVSGTPVRRPRGQIRVAGADVPTLEPTQRLDYELELGLWIGEGNVMGEPIPLAQAADHVAGVTLLNDWSARDIQAWEYQPLGPFLAKNFASTISPWLVTMEALAPFRTAPHPRPKSDPDPLPYLSDAGDRATGALAIDLEVALRSQRMRANGASPVVVGRTSALHLYWTPAQFLAHHSVNGCPMEPGDLLGTGTISGPDKDGFGSLMEITSGGRNTFMLGGEERSFLADGDEVVMTGHCTREGYVTIGLGECRAIVEPANL